MEGTKDFVTTDNAIIEADIPNECPFILAQDTRYDQPKWRIFLKKSEKGRHILIFEFGKKRIEFDRDMTVKENGKIVDVREGNTVKLFAGSVTKKNNQLYFKSNVSSFILFYCIVITIISLQIVLMAQKVEQILSNQNCILFLFIFLLISLWCKPCIFPLDRLPLSL